MSQEHRRQKQLPGHHLVAALVLAVLVSCGTTSVVARAYAACDVGINASANAFGLIALLPVLAIVHGVALIVTYTVTGRWMMSPALRAGVSVLTTVVVVVVLSWAYFALAGLPLRNALCPAGEPPWWPYWLPPSHDVYP
ncbi:hypothetical protein OG799_18220 [Micromonospora sp. NBC_00898]|uniref:hypothetical protein n=1 Tax=Micromonospora sp. NBC_00898 TaxID=2975981 RepID=UPI00386AA6FB|nr:hypothetical protein OG799_18220 [Micromonospora sp. NBC_00898]